MTLTKQIKEIKDQKQQQQSPREKSIKTSDGGSKVLIKILKIGPWLDRDRLNQKLFITRRPHQNPRAAAPSPSPRVSPIKPRAADQSPALRCFMAPSIQLLKVVSEPQKPIPSSNCRRGAAGSPANKPRRAAPRTFTSRF